MKLRFGIELEGRKRNRLPGYDYSRPGFYFITICSKYHEIIFGDIKNGVMQLNELGILTQSTLRRMPQQYANVSLDAHVVMPNHIHCIIQILALEKNSNKNASTKKVSISTIVGSFKGVSKRKARKKFGYEAIVWKRSFHDRIIHNATELHIVRKYIRNNPRNWNKNNIP